MPIEASSIACLPAVAVVTSEKGFVLLGLKFYYKALKERKRVNCTSTVAEEEVFCMFCSIKLLIIDKRLFGKQNQN